jgi:hypothetical protein
VGFRVTRCDRGRRLGALLHAQLGAPPGGRGPPAEGRSCRTSVSISLQVQHRRASLCERCREGGVAAILDLHCADVLRLAADDAVPPDRVGVGFRPYGERFVRLVRLQYEVLPCLGASVKPKVSTRNVPEFPVGAAPTIRRRHRELICAANVVYFRKGAVFGLALDRILRT